MLLRAKRATADLFSCIVISETWFNNFTYTPQFDLDGYNFFAIPGVTNQVVASLFTF